MLMTLDTPDGPNAKFLKKKWPENAGKIKEKLVFPHFGFWFKNYITIQLWMQKIREKSQVIKSEGL